MSESTALVHVPREKWYRVDARHGSMSVETFDVTKHTPCGVWLESEVFRTRRFVLKTARKRYACPTFDEALESFIARKKRQRAILRHQLRDVLQMINYAEQRGAQLKERKYLELPRLGDDFTLL